MLYYDFSHRLKVAGISEQMELFHQDINGHNQHKPTEDFTELFVFDFAAEDGSHYYACYG